MTTQESPEAQRPSRWPSILFGLLIGAIAFGLAAWHAKSAKLALEELPDADRRALYDRTLESLETVCRSHRENLADYCHDQAEMILRFPECDPKCRSLAEPHLARATR